MTIALWILSIWAVGLLPFAMVLAYGAGRRNDMPLDAADWIVTILVILFWPVVLVIGYPIIVMHNRGERDRKKRGGGKP